MKKSLRRQMARLEKQLYLQNERFIREHTDAREANFSSYEKQYKRATSRYLKVVEIAEVERDIDSSAIVIVGDYHTLNQSQRSFVRVMRHYKSSRRKVKLHVALECFSEASDEFLEKYLSGKISEKVFLRKTGFDQRWYFDLWPHYKVILDFARENKISIHGIEHPQSENLSLHLRDMYMAKNILRLHEKFPEDKIFVLTGDLHLAPQHLPREIARQNSELRHKILILFENAPTLYFKLAEKNLVDQALVVKVRKKAYCRLHTPPVIAQMSYINWLHHETGEIDWHDAQDSFLSLLKRMSSFLGVKLPKGYDQLEVYTCGDHSFFSALKNKKIFSKQELKVIREQVLNAESYIIPQARIVYLGNLSLNHAAEEAGHYLKFLLSGAEQARTHVDAFYANILHEALGFFASKLINPKRKCARLSDFKSILRESQNKELARDSEGERRVRVAHLVLAEDNAAKSARLLHHHQISHLDSEIFLAVTHAVGYNLGDQLYYKFIAEVISKKKIRKLFSDSFEEEGEPGREYLALRHLLKGAQRPVQV